MINCIWGVLYLEGAALSEAEAAFLKQIKNNELAKCHYYLALTYNASGNKDKYKTHLQKAKSLYEQELNMFEVYTHQIDKIFLADILDELKLAETTPN